MGINLILMLCNSWGQHGRGQCIRRGDSNKKWQSGSIKAGRGVAVDLRCLSLKELLLLLLTWRLKNAWFFSAQTCADLLGWVIFIQVLVFWTISTM